MLPIRGTPSRSLARGRVSRVALAASDRGDLAAFADHLEFFTPALLYLRGRFRDDLLHDYASTHNVDLAVYERSFVRPVFRGLEAADGNPYWNHTLWAARRGVWAGHDAVHGLRDFLLTAKLTDSRRRVLYGIGVQRLAVLDPLFMDRCVVIPERVPVVSVWGFGVNGSHAAWAYRSDDARPWVPPEPVRLDPDPRMTRFARDVFGERNPYDALEPDPEEAIREAVERAGGHAIGRGWRERDGEVPPELHEALAGWRGSHRTRT